MTDPYENIPQKTTPPLRSIVEIVRQRAQLFPDTIAYIFLADGASDARSMTWEELDRSAQALGNTLHQQGATGQPVLLLLPSGLEFIQSLFACWYAGAIAVPISMPRHQRAKHRLDRILNDAQASHAIGSPETRRLLENENTDKTPTHSLSWLHPDETSEAAVKRVQTPVSENAPAIIQYTSGSTGNPRGVIVTHKNLMRNSALTAEACGHQPGDTIAGWLPLFHDMGLIGLVIQTAYVGTRCVFMSPERFLMRPWLWLKMISDYNAVSSPAPNFAYDLCAEKITPEQKAQLNLGGWRNALNGSEPVRAETLQQFASAFASCGFQRESFFPCYGLAEATLFVTGPRASRRLTRRTAAGKLLTDSEPGGHVGCGSALQGTRLAIVDPVTLRRVPPGNVGEIWVMGESCASGYWNNPTASADTFCARTHGEEPSNESSQWLRTGDLGFIADDELFITGRLRELIILAGRNLFPVDLERTAQAADPLLAVSGVVAFSMDSERGERLMIAAEVHRDRANAPLTVTELNAVRRRISAAITAEHEVVPHQVVLLQPGALPRTTSGKLNRRATYDAYANQTLKLFEGAQHAHANI